MWVRSSVRGTPVSGINTTEVVLTSVRKIAIGDGLVRTVCGVTVPAEKEPTVIVG